MEIYVNEETGERVEIRPAPHGGQYVEMIPVHKEPRRIDWSKALTWDLTDTPGRIIWCKITGIAEWWEE